MTSHKTGTREEWLAARLDLLEAEKELTRRSDELARQRQELPWVRVDKDYRFETERGHGVARRPVPRPLAAARLPLHVRSRLHRGVPVLLGDRRRLQRLGGPPRQPRRHARARSPARRSTRSRRTSGGWAGPSRGRPPTAATSTSTSAWRTPRRNGRRAPSGTTSARRTCGPATPAAGELARRLRAVDRRHRLADLPQRGAGDERVRPCRTAPSTTPTRRTRAVLTRCGACTSGSTAHRSAATSPGQASGGAATTSTTRSEPPRGPAFAAMPAKQGLTGR